MRTSQSFERGKRLRRRAFEKFVAERGADERCAICLDAFEDPTRVVVTTCGHAMHRACMTRNNQTKMREAVCAGFAKAKRMPLGRKRVAEVRKVLHTACRILMSGTTCPVCRAPRPTEDLFEASHTLVARAVFVIEAGVASVAARA